MAIRFTGNSSGVGIDADANFDTWITRRAETVASAVIGFNFFTVDFVQYYVEGSVFSRK